MRRLWRVLPPSDRLLVVLLTLLVLSTSGNVAILLLTCGPV